MSASALGSPVSGMEEEGEEEAPPASRTRDDLGLGDLVSTTSPLLLQRGRRERGRK